MQKEENVYNFKAIEEEDGSDQSKVIKIDDLIRKQKKGTKTGHKKLNAKALLNSRTPGSKSKLNILTKEDNKDNKKGQLLK